MKIYHYALLLTVLIFTGCRSHQTPKPMGYPRVDYPEKSYVLYDDAAPYSFEYPSYAKVVPDTDPNSEPWWVNVVIPSLKGTIHISYKPVHNNLEKYIEDSRTLVYKHATKAENIEETPFLDPENRRFGIIYDLSGNVASGVQFFITDSTRNFLRGSLYFNSTPNKDSLYPVISFVREDIVHLIETTRWK
ncbi:MAG: gliding motility lipoprotein GldD [Bacteroidota bacterium]